LNAQGSAFAGLLSVVACTIGCSRVVGLDELTFNQEPECRTHTECVETELAPSICRNSRCLQLTNYDSFALEPDQHGDCRVVVGAENLESGFEPFLFGAFARIDPATPQSSPAVLNYKLAVQEFSKRGGLSIAGASRLPVAVVCNADVAPERLERSMDFLVDTLGVSAIIAAITDVGDLRSSFEHVRQKSKDVFFSNPHSSSNVLTSLQDARLWHLLPDVLDVAPAYVPLVTRVEHYINPATASGSRPPIRLALVVANDFTKLDGIGEVLNGQLRFNDKSAADNEPDHYLPLVVTSPFTDPAADLSPQLEKLRAFRPHIIVSAASSEFLEKILPELEKDWPESEAPRPFYVLSPYQRGPAVLELAKYDWAYQLRRRIVGVNIAGAEDPTLYDAYLSRLKLQFPDAHNLDSTENYYDAVYLLLYAAAAGAEGREPMGTDVANGMQRLLRGIRYDVGPKDLVDAMRYLEEDRERTISLYGTLGPPDFDANGARRGTGSVWCIDEIEDALSGATAWHLHFDTLRFDPEQGVLTGALPCIEGF
jgi:hypothetical protein